MVSTDRAAPAAGVSIRWRLTLGVLAMLFAVLGTVGVGLFTLVRSQIDQRVTDELTRAADEFRVLASQGVDPDTGQPFTTADDLLQVALARTVLAPSEDILGYVDGQIRWTAPEGVVLRPEQDPGFIAHLNTLRDAPDVRIGALTTPVRQYRYLVAPVSFAATATRGALVRAVDIEAERAVLYEMTLDYVVIAGGSLLLAAGVVAVWVRRALRPIGWLREAAARITQEALSERVPVRGSDELAALTTTVNQMLDRIETGVTAQRNLLDDVGHELRTPVTVVRGHLELMDATDPADVLTTRAVALDELDRMGGLVDHLITLARASQPDFVRPRPTEVAALTDSTLTKARMLGDRRWTMSRVADAEVRLDPDRITQAWLQLAANAVKYSSPGSTVDIGSRVSGDELRLWVTDSGIGIAAHELDAVRSRFGRAAGVRGRIEGSGLGLSIVESIATAHGGRLDIDSAPGVGSSFTIILPIDHERGAP